MPYPLLSDRGIASRPLGGHVHIRHASNFGHPDLICRGHVALGVGRAFDKFAARSTKWNSLILLKTSLRLRD